MITYDRLWETMKKRGITQYHLIKHEKFSAGQIGRLKNNMTVSTQTLDTLCRLLSCRIEDIVTYTPDNGEPLPEPETEQDQAAKKKAPSLYAKAKKGIKLSKKSSKKASKSEKGEKPEKNEMADKGEKKAKKKYKDKDKDRDKDKDKKPGD